MMFLTPEALMSSQVWGTVRMRSSAAATASGSVGSTITPWCSVAMMSTGLQSTNMAGLGGEH